MLDQREEKETGTLGPPRGRCHPNTQSDALPASRFDILLFAHVVPFFCRTELCWAPPWHSKPRPLSWPFEAPSAPHRGSCGAYLSCNSICSLFFLSFPFPSLFLGDKRCGRRHTCGDCPSLTGHARKKKKTNRSARRPSGEEREKEAAVDDDEAAANGTTRRTRALPPQESKNKFKKKYM